MRLQLLGGHPGVLAVQQRMLRQGREVGTVRGEPRRCSGSSSSRSRRPAPGEGHGRELVRGVVVMMVVVVVCRRGRRSSRGVVRVVGVEVRVRGAHERRRLGHEVRLLHPLVALPPSQEAAVVEHVLAGRVESPVVALAGVARLPRDLDEAVVEGEVVADAVLPGWELLPEVREAVHDEVADSRQRQPLPGRLQDGHGDEGDVGVWRLHQVRLLLAGILVDGVARVVVVVVVVVHAPVGHHIPVVVFGVHLVLQTIQVVLQTLEVGGILTVVGTVSCWKVLETVITFSVVTDVIFVVHIVSAVAIVHRDVDLMVDVTTALPLPGHSGGRGGMGLGAERGGGGRVHFQRLVVVNVNIFGSSGLVSTPIVEFVPADIVRVPGTLLRLHVFSVAVVVERSMVCGSLCKV